MDNLYFELFKTEPRKGDLRRRKIVLATITCIATNGIEGTTFESIGKLLRLRKSHVAYYFPDKTALVEAAVRLITATAQSITVEHIQKSSAKNIPENMLDAFVAGAFDWVKRHPDQVSVMLLFFQYCTHNRKYRNLYTEIRTAGRNRLTEIVENERVASQIQALITGAIVDYATTFSRVPLSQIEKETLESSRTLSKKLPRKLSGKLSGKK